MRVTGGDHVEDSKGFLSMMSRILQLLLIDIMAVGLSIDAHKGREKEAARSEVGRVLISQMGS